MTATLDEKMQTASQALADMDYARCEALCVQALAQARGAQDWAMVRRVLLPLQEARRLKRQAALDGLIQLGTPAKADDLSALIADPDLGCIVLTPPYTADDASALRDNIHQDQRAIEVLFADNAADAATWRITTCLGPKAFAELPPPDAAWVGQSVAALVTTPPTPAHWFMGASEALGNAALAAVDAPMGSVERFDQLADALAAAGDHEILHQRLADAAKALQEAQR